MAEKSEPTNEWNNPDVDDETKAKAEAAATPKTDSTSARGNTYDDISSGSYASAVKILQEDRRMVCGQPIRYNELSGRIDFGELPLKDVDVLRTRANMERDIWIAGKPDKNDKPGPASSFKIGFEELCRAFEHVAYDNPYHPVREYLASCAAADHPRLNLGFALCQILGIDSSDKLAPVLLEKFMICAVARIIRPGCKVDTMLILVGDQGIGKSTFAEKLFFPWYTNTTIQLGTKDAFQQIQGKWCVEWAELDAFRGREAGALKAYMSSATDSFRASYARFSGDSARQCVFLGTTNDGEFLVDSTGNRRYQPVHTGQVNIRLLEMVRDQLWAEALHRYREGASWWLDKGQSVQLDTLNAEHMVIDPWQLAIERWIRGCIEHHAKIPHPDGDAWLTTQFIMDTGLDLKPKDQKKSDRNRVCHIMRSLGYSEHRVDSKPRFWRKPGTPAALVTPD